jgi:hypothetical protein
LNHLLLRLAWLAHSELVKDVLHDSSTACNIQKETFKRYPGKTSPIAAAAAGLACPFPIGLGCPAGDTAQKISKQGVLSNPNNTLERQQSSFHLWLLMLACAQSVEHVLQDSCFQAETA